MKPLTIKDLDLETRILPWLRSLDPETVVYGEDTFDCTVVRYANALDYGDVKSGYAELTVYDGGHTDTVITIKDTPLSRTMFEWDDWRGAGTGMTAARAIEIAERVLAEV